MPIMSTRYAELRSKVFVSRVKGLYGMTGSFLILLMKPGSFSVIVAVSSVVTTPH
jgi:hypothetical protein